MNRTRRTSGATQIGGHEAHVWTLSTVVDGARLGELEARLPGEERARAARIRHPAAHRGFVVARSALRELLARYLGEPDEGVKLRYSPKGKPALVQGGEPALRFSVAHSGGLALIAFGLVDVGVDVELIRSVPRERRVMDRVFPPATRTLLSSLPEAERRAAFFAAWTQKEALVKAIGGALLATPDPLDFLWPQTPVPRHFEHASPGSEREIWTVAALPQPSGFAATLVARGAVRDVRIQPFRGF